MDASLQQAYAPRDPLAEHFRGEITLRQLRVLVEALPPDSPLVRAVEGSSWGNIEWLLWDISSSQRALRADVANALGAKPRITPEFLPTPRDRTSVAAAVEDEQKRAAERAEMDQTIQRIFADPN